MYQKQIFPHRAKTLVLSYNILNTFFKIYPPWNFFCHFCAFLVCFSNCFLWAVDIEVVFCLPAAVSNRVCTEVQPKWMPYTSSFQQPLVGALETSCMFGKYFTGCQWGVKRGEWLVWNPKLNWGLIRRADVNLCSGGETVRSSGALTWRKEKSCISKQMEYRWLTEDERWDGGM